MRPWQTRFFKAVAVWAFLGVAAPQLGLAAPPEGGPINELQKQVAALQATVANQQIIIGTLQQQIAALQPLQALASFVTVESNVINCLKGPHIIITGANLHLRSGSGSTSDNAPDDTSGLTGLGNLLLGYNEIRPGYTSHPRSGSHNLIVGFGHEYPSYSGLVAGYNNAILSRCCSVTGGNWNTASSWFASVTGGGNNTASGAGSSVSSGAGNTASGVGGWVGGGQGNKAQQMHSSISGGCANTASGGYSLVGGGNGNTASGTWSAVLGGYHQTAANELQTIPALP